MAAGKSAALALALALAACSSRVAPQAGSSGGGAATTPGQSPVDPIAALRPFEEEVRRGLDLARPPSAETGLGADPWAVRRVAGGFVGILRGRAALVLLDDALKEIARIPAPRSPTGLAVTPAGEVIVVGELSPAVARFSVRERTLVPLGETRVAGVHGLRDVTVAPSGAVWVADDRGRIHRAPGGPSAFVGHGVAQIVATARHVVADAVTDHEIVVLPADATKAPEARIRHDGPFWGFDARETPKGLVVVAGGVENHPLDRREGFFGYVDSFVYAYRVEGGRASPIGAVNVSELGVVTPKAIAIEAISGDRIDALVTGYGGATAVRLSIGDPVRSAPITLVPGVRALEVGSKAIVMASPLLDAWVRVDEGRATVVPVRDGAAARDVRSRLGEALFFTSLMAPKNTSAGAHSRFTCETCHFEGYVDGRTHHTGREDIHATTKPLVGLVGNRPHFSRALDPDLATVSHAEFRVAGAGNPDDPFFDVDPREHPWLAHLGVEGPLSALDLRRALLRFLADFSHRPNPASIGRATFTPEERDGAAIFERRCASCHAALLSTDDPSTLIAPDRWESMILSEAAPIVWGSAGYRKTGVEPYVHPEGARTPSLRRLYKKHPYFTNGSARSIDDVLDGVRLDGDRFFHQRAPDGATGVGVDQKRALRAFLELL
ncbi:MAG: hypothetical protein KF819_32005 [Labilithrix sp.]|nr:hypothetical protein [Labilithrix sp.]